VFQVAYLDSGYRLLRDGVDTLEEGTIDRAAVYPRRVIEAALRRGVAALVFAHNHPNGDVRPTEQDKVLTRAPGPGSHDGAHQGARPSHCLPDSVLSFRQEGLL
jgi:DNA repair protein RadC